jgi:hypothetical protein
MSNHKKSTVIQIGFTSQCLMMQFKLYLRAPIPEQNNSQKRGSKLLPPFPVRVHLVIDHSLLCTST